MSLPLLIGFGLHHFADSTIFTAALIGVAVLMIGLKRAHLATLRGESAAWRGTPRLG